MKNFTESYKKQVRAHCPGAWCEQELDGRWRVYGMPIRPSWSSSTARRAWRHAWAEFVLDRVDTQRSEAI